MPSVGQIRVIQVAKRKLGLDEDVYREVLKRSAGVSSSKELDYIGFDKVMNEFERLGFRSDWKERTYGNRPGMASPSQIELIRKLWQEYFGADDEPALNAWLNKFHKVSALRMVNSAKAAKVIPALRRMAARPKAKH